MMKKLSALLAPALLAFTLALPVTVMAQSPAQFIEAAREGLRMQTRTHQKAWRMGEEKQWLVDPEAGTILFLFESGQKATAPVQIIGAYDRVDGTFTWGWSNPSVPESLRAHALLARQWGERQRLESFTAAAVRCSEEEAWNFAATANRLAAANGVYRGESGSALVFMTLGDVRLQKPRRTRAAR